MIVDTILWSRLHISFSFPDYMTNYYILDIIISIVLWSCFITLHNMFASRSYTCMQPTRIDMIFACIW